MVRYPIATAGAICAAQLLEEIAGSTGHTVSVTYYPPQEVEISGADHVDFSGIVFAHVPAITTPPKVSTWRLHAVTELAGLTALIAAAINALPLNDRVVADAAWFHSFETERSSVLLAQLAAAIGLSSAEVDDLFRQAQALEV